MDLHASQMLSHEQSITIGNWIHFSQKFINSWINNFANVSTTVCKLKSKQICI